MASFGHSAKPVSKWAVLILALLLGTLKFTHLQNNILSYDYFGLYLYLPATFIYDDPAIADISWLEQINAQYNNTPMFYQLAPHEGYNIIRFFSGMAMLLSPFFFMGHMAAQWTAFPADGFSQPYQLAMTFAAWFYVVVGLIFLRKVLRKIFNEEVTALTLVILYLGTNLFFWTTFDAGAPHTILFSLYALLLWFTMRWHEKPNKVDAAAMGLLLGLIIVSRPSEIIAILIPLLWGVYDKESFANKVTLVRRHIPHLLWLVFFTVLAGLPQMIYYFTFTGKIYFSTYNDPQSVMEWFRPRFAWVLFSFRKGWFIYAPLMLLIVPGFYILYRKNKAIFTVIMAHFVLNLYFISVFTSLVSYGWRAFIQSYALLAIPLAYMVQYVVRRGRAVQLTAVAVLIVFTGLTVFQSWQLKMGILHGSRMTRDYYFSVFGKTAIDENDRKLLRIDHYMDEPNYKMPDTSNYQSYMLQQFDFRQADEVLAQGQARHDSILPAGFHLHDERIFSPAVKVPFNKITDRDHFWARITFRVYAESQSDASDLLLVATFSYRGLNSKMRNKPYKYRAISFATEGLKAGEWKEFQLDYLSPEPTTKRDRFETYLWNISGKSFVVDRFSVQIFEPLP